MELLDNYEGILFENSLTWFHADGGYLAVLLSLDVVLHLHRLENDNCIASFYFLTNSHLDAGDGTGRGAFTALAVFTLAAGVASASSDAAG